MSIVPVLKSHMFCSEITSFGVGSSGILTQSDAKAWKIDTRTWIGRHEADVSLSREPIPWSYKDEARYALDANYADQQLVRS